MQREARRSGQPPSRSWMLAGCGSSTSPRPSVSTSAWRLRPLIFCPHRSRAGRPVSVVLTLWLSIIAAEGWRRARPPRDLPSRARGLSAQSARRHARRRTSGRSSPRRQVARHQSPRAACPHDIEDAIDDFPHRPLARPAHRAGLRQVRRDYPPLCVGQIGLVSGNGAAMLLSSGRCPHGESKVGSRTPSESRRAP